MDAWCEESPRLGALPFVNEVTIFENRGFSMGASNPHPHCQIWANQSLPNQIVKERDSQRQYLRDHGRCLLCDYLALELARRVGRAAHLRQLQLRRHRAVLGGVAVRDRRDRQAARGRD